MKTSSRYLLAFGLLLLDWVIFIVPIGGILIACVLLARPAWFRDWVQKLYSES